MYLYIYTYIYIYTQLVVIIIIISINHWYYQYYYSCAGRRGVGQGGTVTKSSAPAVCDAGVRQNT